MHRLVMFAASVLGFVGAAAAQTQWFVGPGGYAQIRDVMPLVADGDTVVVAPGTYFTFQCTRGVTIRAATAGTVAVAWSLVSIPPSCGCTCLSMQGPTSFAPPVGRTVHVVGVNFVGSATLTPCFFAVQHRPVVTSGRVTFDECALDHLVVQNAIVHLQDCTVTSGFAGAGLTATSADVTIAGGTIASSVGTPGIAFTNSRVHASHVTVNGGPPAAPGIEGNGGSLWLSDSTVTSTGACAISATGLVRIDRSTLNGAAGGGCAVSPTGAPLVGADRAAPIQIGATFQLTLTSEPGALLVVYGSIGLAAPLLVPVVDQPVWIDPGLLFLADLATATPLGQTTFAYPVPGITALVGAQFWLQGVGGTSFPLQTSPVVGGVVR